MKTTTVTFYDWASLGNAANTGYYLESVSGVDVRKVRTPSQARRLICDHAYQVRDNYHYSNSPFGYRVIQEVGDQFIEAPAIYVERKKVLTPDFKKRCADGEIIMNPYYTGFGVVSVDSLEDASSAAVSLSTTLNWAPLDQSEFNNFYGVSASGFNVSAITAKAFSPTGNTVKDFYFMTGQGYDCPRAGTNLLLKQYRRIIYGVDGFKNHFKMSPTELKDSVVARCKDFQIDSMLVTETAAKANSGDIDALTSIAEMPELIQSIIDGFRLLQKITADARKKDFMVHQNSKASALARLKKKYGDYVARKTRRMPSYKKWSSRPANRGKSIKDYHIWVKDTKENFMSWLSYLSKNDKKYKAMIRAEYATASAGVWLNYRYNISTTVMMLEDVGDVLLNLGTEYFRYREKVIHENFIDFQALFPDTTVSFEGTCNQTHRTLIKRQYAVATAVQQLGRALMADVLVTMYEKIPLWSIIADWFFTITPFLKAINWNPKDIQEKCSYSVKSEVHGNVHLTKSIQGKQITSVVRLDFDTYRRVKLTPSAHLGIRWNPDLSWKRQVDAIAFLWSKQKGIYKNYYMN